MRRLVTTLFLILLPSLLHAESFRGVVTEIPHGDTLRIVRDDFGTTEIVRLYGLACPKPGQHYGKEAREYTESLAAGMTVIVEVMATDRKGRTVGNVTLPDGTRLGHSLMKNGWAWWYRERAPDNEFYQALEHQARVRRIGLWRDPNPVPPWEWRSQRKTGKHPVPAD